MSQVEEVEVATNQKYQHVWLLSLFLTYSLTAINTTIIREAWLSLVLRVGLKQILEKGGDVKLCTRTWRM